MESRDQALTLPNVNLRGLTAAESGSKTPQKATATAGDGTGCRPSFSIMAFRNGSQDRNSGIRRLNDNNLSTLCKFFGDIRFSSPRVNDVNMCTAGVDHYWGLFNYVRWWAVLLSTAAISYRVCFTTIFYFAGKIETMQGRADYTLGFATHF